MMGFSKDVLVIPEVPKEMEVQKVKNLSKRRCKKPPRGASKELLSKLHKLKMVTKKAGVKYQRSNDGSLVANYHL